MVKKYIFVYQNVRGRYLSEGTFEEMTPAPTVTQAVPVPSQPLPHDESTNTFDIIEWLLKNITHNNDRGGMLGISYPDFYASVALPNARPALKTVSPQAPVINEFFGNDTQYKDAFFYSTTLNSPIISTCRSPRPWLNKSPYSRLPPPTRKRSSSGSAP